MSSCLRERHRSSINDDMAIPPAVVVLLRRCRPSAVVGRVGPIVVNAVETASFGTRAHVAEERFEAVAPRVDDCNPAGTIAWEFLTLPAEAPIAHALPSVVLGGLSRACRMAMLRNTSDSRRALRASERAPVSQKATIVDAFSSTLTSTEPARPGRTRGVGGAMKDGPSAPYGSSHIDRSSHREVTRSVPTV